jgi:hypothetical protein
MMLQDDLASVAVDVRTHREAWMRARLVVTR